METMASNVRELRPKTGDSEKITINLGYVDLGHVDLLVQEGFYSNRTDFIRTAIRNQLDRHNDSVKRSVVRHKLELGLRRYSREDLEAVQAAGDRDHTVSPVNGDQVIAQSKAGAELQLTTTHGRSAGGISYTRTVRADASGRPILEQWVLHGAGHAWSGGSPAGSYTDPEGPDASREMLRFFLQASEASG